MVDNKSADGKRYCQLVVAVSEIDKNNVFTIVKDNKFVDYCRAIYIGSLADILKVSINKYTLLIILSDFIFCRARGKIGIIVGGSIIKLSIY